MGVEPIWTGLQPVAWPSGSSVYQTNIKICPRQESNLALDLRRVVCLRHTPRTGFHGNSTNNPPSGNRTQPCGFEGRRASSTLAGSALARSRTWASTFGGSRAVRHTPRAGFSSRGARIRTLSIRVGAGVLSYEDTPVCCDLWFPLDLMCLAGLEPAPSASQAGMLPLTPQTQRKGRDSNPQGCSLARVPGGSRLQVRVALPSNPPTVGGEGVEPTASGMSYRRSGLLS